MKISMICYTLTGQQTGEKLKKGLEKEGNIVFLFTKSKYIPDSIKGSCGKWTGEQFETADSIIFIGAAGIAVRSIAPFIQNKKKDPEISGSCYYSFSNDVCGVMLHSKRY